MINETASERTSVLWALLAREDPKYPQVQFDTRLLSLAKDCLARQAGVAVENITDQDAKAIVMEELCWLVDTLTKEGRWIELRDSWYGSDIYEEVAGHMASRFITADYQALLRPHP